MFRHSSNRKDMVWTSKEYTLIVYRPNGKDVVLWRLFFEVAIIMVKDKKTLLKIQCQSKLVLWFTWSGQ